MFIIQDSKSLQQQVPTLITILERLSLEPRLLKSTNPVFQSLRPQVPTLAIVLK
jgi:hypothetical protein